MSPKKEKENKPKIRIPKNFISIIISIFALIISSLSLYFQFFWENHKIYIAIMESNINITQSEFDIVILNDGNKSEYIHRLKTVYSKKQNLNNEIYIFTCNKKPIHIKPGEKVPFKMLERKGSENLDVPINKDELMYIGLEVDFLGTDGFTQKTRYLLAKYSKQNKKGELLTERIEINTE